MSSTATIPRALYWLSSLLFIVAAAIFLVAVNDLFMQQGTRVRIDATKSRSYSLSPRTMQLLDTLGGDWSITVVMIESDTDPAVVRQIDEVLQRYRESSDRISVQRIDPSNAAALTDYDQLLMQLRDREGDEIEAFESAIESARQDFADLIVFAVPIAEQIDQMMEVVPPDSEKLREAGAIAAALRLLGQQGHLVLAKVDDSLAMEPGAPLPDLETARSILEQGLSRWSRELQTSSRKMTRAESSGQVPAQLQPRFTDVQEALATEAATLAVGADRLHRLEPLELARIAGRLQEGEAAIIVGPHRAMAIPASQLFATNLQQDEVGSVRIDQRFRGEQLLSSAIVSMQRDVMPTVVFVHGDETSKLDPHPQQADIIGIVTLLEAARIEVAEWPVAVAPQPAFPAGTPVVWVILPPSERIGFEISTDEKRLLESTAHLIAQGQPVLLSLYPSFLPRYGQSDPWAILAQDLGIEAATGSVLLQESVDGDGSIVVQMFQQLTEFPEDHPVASALNGQSLALPLPVPLRPLNDQAEFGPRVVASIEPGSSHWLETEWTPSLDLGPVQQGDQSLEEPVDVMYAVERSQGEGIPPQRILVVGSGPWMLTNVADVAVSAGGDRISLLHPGNHELMMAAVAWLAGDDDLVAQGPLSQEVARLRGVGDRELQVVGWLLTLVLPGCVLLIGLGVWMARRT